MSRARKKTSRESELEAQLEAQRLEMWALRQALAYVAGGGRIPALGWLAFYGKFQSAFVWFDENCRFSYCFAPWDRIRIERERESLFALRTEGLQKLSELDRLLREGRASGQI